MVKMVSQQKANIIVVGDGAVGKTSILAMYKDGTSTDTHMPTLGLDYI